MDKHFRCIGIVGHPREPMPLSTHKMLGNWLIEQGYEVLVEYQLERVLALSNIEACTLEEIGERADLVVVIGGDGNMLGAARVLAHHNVKVIGINRGNLGFLADLSPDDALYQLRQVLQGYYISEDRFLLEAQIYCQERLLRMSSAVNEVVLHTKKIAHMIEFDVYIDDTFAFSQRSDGLIISTPTGSTAYSLSAGGPILTPSLNAIVLVPMYPHTLSARPLVIDKNSHIRLHFSRIERELEISCDCQVTLQVHEGEDVIVRCSAEHLNLIHPKKYNYYNTLDSKLGWSKKLF